MEELLHQWYCFLLSMGCGAFLTVCYMLLNGLQALAGLKAKKGRALKGKKYFLICLGDILFWLLAAVFCFLVIFRENWGEVRSYMLLGSLLGMIFVLFLWKGLKKFLNRVTIRQQ